MPLSSLRADGTLALHLGRKDDPMPRRTDQSRRWLRSAPDAQEASATMMAATSDRTEIHSSEPADHELLQRYKDGEEKGYVELYVRRQADVYTFCLRLAAGDRDLASDLFQDVWLKVYRKAHTFREGTNVLGWLYTIARTTFLNHRRQRSHIGLDEQHSAIESTDRSMNPEFRNEQQTLRLRVEAAIAELPIEIREPFILREFDGFSYVEIAEQLSITHGAVRQRIYRAKQAMREMLADLIEDDEMNEVYQSEEERGSARERSTPQLQRKKDHGNV